MSLYDYQQTWHKEIEEASFYTLLMAAIKKADDYNLYKLEAVFSDLVEEVKARYSAPGGRLESDEPTLIDKVREAAREAKDTKELTWPEFICSRLPESKKT